MCITALTMSAVLCYGVVGGTNVAKKLKEPEPTHRLYLRVTPGAWAKLVKAMEDLDMTQPDFLSTALVEGAEAMLRNRFPERYLTPAMLERLLTPDIVEFIVEGLREQGVNVVGVPDHLRAKPDKEK
jgi:hypothetical protein